MAYKDGELTYVECKETKLNTLNIKSNIKKNQIEMMTKNTKGHKGVKGGFMVHFKTHNAVVWTPIEKFNEEIVAKGYKSINFKKMLTDDNIYFKIIAQGKNKNYKDFNKE